MMLFAVSRVSPHQNQRTLQLGAGVTVPYPVPSSAAASAIGRANKRTDTSCEVAVRSALHRGGLRFRKDLALVGVGRRVRPDVVFTRARVAVFIDGCFWHSCPVHGRVPKSNLDYWLPKLERNRQRDQEVDAALADAGWVIVRVWEHEVPEAVAAHVKRVVKARLRHEDAS